MRPEQNFAASMATTRAMQLLNEFPKPTIALVHGACFGGGCGMVCCVDVAFATPDALFGLTEVRVGVAPTPISTHMVNAMGLRHTRRYALTGERFERRGGASALAWCTRLVPADALESKAGRRAGRDLPQRAGRDRDDQAQLPGRQRAAAGRAPDDSCWRMRAGRSASPRRGMRAPQRFGKSAGRVGTDPRCSDPHHRGVAPNSTGRRCLLEGFGRNHPRLRCCTP